MPVRGSLLHGYVTAVSKRDRYTQKPSGNRYNGTYGLQVWKVAQLVEQETIPSPRFDSWLSELSRKNYNQADCGKRFSTQGIWQQLGAFLYAEKVMRYVAPGLYPAIVGSIPTLRIHKI